MYRLLIVTDDQSVKDRISAMEGWETLGFKPPRIRSTVEEAKECMARHPIDAIAVDQEPAFAPLYDFLNENRPSMPLFAIDPTAEKQMETVREVSSLLARMKADDSNDEYNPAAKLDQQRERWLCKVIAGTGESREVLARRLRLYRCREKLDVPCVLARIAMPDDDTFLSERWHYGSERLETALRNFFGRGHDHMLIHVAVVSQDEVRVLCYPQNEEDGLSESAAFAYIQETVDQIEHYLGLAMRVLEVRRLNGLQVFAAEE